MDLSGDGRTAPTAEQEWTVNDMRFNNWKLDDLIEFLIRMKSAPSDRLDYHCVTRCWGEIFIENGERKDGEG